MSDVGNIRDQAMNAKNLLDDGNAAMAEAELRRVRVLERAGQIAALLDQAIALAGEPFEVDSEALLGSLQEGAWAYGEAAGMLTSLAAASTNLQAGEARDWAVAAHNQTSSEQSGALGSLVCQDGHTVAIGLESVRAAVGRLADNAAALEPDLMVIIMQSAAATHALEGYVSDITSQG